MLYCSDLYLSAMNTLSKIFQSIAFTSLFLFLSIILISCSDENTEKQQSKYDHSHAESTDMKKHLFEHIFAEQCMASESANLADKDTAKKDFAKPCMCVAVYMFKDLSAQDSYSLLNDKKQAQVLRSRYQQAAEKCL